MKYAVAAMGAEGAKGPEEREKVRILVVSVPGARQKVVPGQAIGVDGKRLVAPKQQRVGGERIGRITCKGMSTNSRQPPHSLLWPATAPATASMSQHRPHLDPTLSIPLPPPLPPTLY